MRTVAILENSRLKDGTYPISRSLLSSSRELSLPLATERESACASFLAGRAGAGADMVVEGKEGRQVGWQITEDRLRK